MQSSQVQFVGIFCDKIAGNICGKKEVVAVQLCEKGEILEFLLSWNGGRRRAQLLGCSPCSAAARSVLCSAAGSALRWFPRGPRTSWCIFWLMLMAACNTAAKAGEHLSR